MSDFALLQASLNTKNRELLERHLRPHAIQPMTKELLRGITEYDTHLGEDVPVTLESFKSWFKTVKHASSPDKKMEPYEFVFAKWERLVEEGAIETDVRLLLNKYIDLDIYARILDVATKGAEGDPDVTPEDITLILEEYHDASILEEDREALDPFEVTTSISEFADDVSTRGLEWPLEELNISCGPLRQGNFVAVGARPETGKTTFISHCATYMAPQLEEDDYILWVNNEEAWQSVVKRLYQSALGLTGVEIDSDIEKYEKMYHEAMGRTHRIRFMDNAVVSVDDIDKFVRRIKPKLIIIDMLDKVQGFHESKRDDIRIQRLYQQGREWCKVYGPVITTTQADASADGVQWIGMGQLAGSKVAKQAETDLIITIGRTDDEGEENMRYLNIPKNKLHGGDRSLESERHGKWPVSINSSIGRYKGMR